MDRYTSTLDTFFILARTTLDIADPASQDVAYDFLSCAARVLNTTLVDDHHITDNKAVPASIDETSYSNFVRCTSGAFHNVAGTLYQAGKHGSTVRFLRQSCALGNLASTLGKKTETRTLKDDSDTEQEEGHKYRDAWKQLEDQLPRRWELRYSKIGHRKVSICACF